MLLVEAETGVSVKRAWASGRGPDEGRQGTQGEAQGAEGPEGTAGAREKGGQEGMEDPERQRGWL